MALSPGLEKSSLAGQAGVTALVMELVEGPTPADWIAHGPIPLDDARPIARQFAEALAAHGLRLTDAAAGPDDQTCGGFESGISLPSRHAR